jgi:hypothetical protein
MFYAIEFQRFRNGHYYWLDFNLEGVIKKAIIQDDELRKDLDVTAYIAEDEYWQGRVDEWLAEYKAEHAQVKSFKAHKDEPEFNDAG